MNSPPLLRSGARVALVAPSGPLRDPSELQRAHSNVVALGWEPLVASHAMSADGYLAGSDADRASDLNDAIADPSIDAIWCLRGGYGAMRLLDSIDYGTLARRPKA